MTTFAVVLVSLALGFALGFVRGLWVRAERATLAVQRMRRGMRWLSVERRRQQERRARWIAQHADEPENG